MSNSVTYDPLLVHYLAKELRGRLRSRGCAAAPSFAPDLSVTLPLDAAEQLRVDLHPTRGWFRVLSAPHQAATFGPEAVCADVTAPADERLLRINLFEEGRFSDQARTLVFELHTNQWNAILLGNDDRIVTVLRPRRAGLRLLRPGERYFAPEGKSRFGASDVDPEVALRQWIDTLEPLGSLDRRRALLTGFAWTGALSVDWILGEQPSDLEASFRRWWWLRSRPSDDPAVLTMDGHRQPYPLRLAGIEAAPAATLLDAMAELADEGSPARQPDRRMEAALGLAEERRSAATRKLERLRTELGNAGEADRLQAIGDLLLAKLHTVPRGASAVELGDWSGETVHIELDPRQSPAENATRYYTEAGRRRRAEQRLPALLSEAQEELERWTEVPEAISSGGAVPDWLGEQLDRRAERSAMTNDEAATLPFRTYRTSGGLEVRVGRSARDNDRLTFHASSPNDVWLHARSVPGSHVILRWPDPDGAPPARDLTEAAQIAAVYSRARTSGTVPVDWTRRKYVRKPRGAAPGAVVPQRVKTIFVEPDEGAVDALREKE
ncbi:MAG: DUF814 domain-containing protein [Gemmatimonas sp.]|nr:DUF814 domain-containing protein [Gemmatimonas sp.]